ncbi:serotransferrin-like isoform X1 [Choloepus didactylus]|uniref:serotransferrin-like isoform X1 n=1 Tax=Choloepus didactylus TaxID=27675 RepID=UPI00189E0C89|nr:serotransferrin-like isoform X1 [Choloepus didactylus]
MKLAVCALLACGVLGLCLATPEKTVKWCTISDHEVKKCNSFRDNMKKVLSADGPLLSCVKRSSYIDCIKSIAANEADAVTLDAGWVYEAGLAPYNLKPVVAEFYGSKQSRQTHYYAVAVVKKDSGFQLNELSGKKSCHTGHSRSAGWIIPIGLLLPSLPEPRVPVENAVAQFFSGSCVPGVDRQKFPKLCSLCKGTGQNKCAATSQEPYFGYGGAFKCLEEDAGEVAFVKHTTIFESLPDPAERLKYELLCLDNTRKPVDKYKECYTARVPSHAVVARSVGGKEDLIWELLNQAQEHYGKGTTAEFQLFNSSSDKDLLFKDSAFGFLRIPPGMDSWLYLGYQYVTSIRNLKEGISPDSSEKECKKVLWCAVGHHERVKCDEWSVNSEGQIDCKAAENTEDCIAMITKGEADAMSLDGGFIYTAGKCGLLPVLAENYDKSANQENCKKEPGTGYFAVAVVKASDTGITWNTLQGKKSCHTGVGRTAGWNIPMGLLYSQTKSCDFDKFFSQSCAPGSDPESNLCSLCFGKRGSRDPPNFCASNNNERYYGYTGAFRCLVEKGDVAFVKDQTPIQNTDGHNPDDWAKDLKSEDYRLLCLDGTQKPVSEAGSCHLAQAPNHAVVSRQDKATCVQNVLRKQQEAFGKTGSNCPSKFCLFRSETKDLLFRDDTQCLAVIPPETTYEKYLGEEYVAAVANLRQCSTSRLLEACTFHRD